MQTQSTVIERSTRQRFCRLLRLATAFASVERIVCLCGCAGSCTDSRGTARVSCAAHCELIWGPVSLLPCGDLNWCTRGVESSVGIRCIETSLLCAVGAERIVRLLGDSEALAGCNCEAGVLGISSWHWQNLQCNGNGRAIVHAAMRCAARHEHHANVSMYRGSHRPR